MCHRPLVSTFEDLPYFRALYIHLNCENDARKFFIKKKNRLQWKKIVNNLQEIIRKNFEDSFFVIIKLIYFFYESKIYIIMILNSNKLGDNYVLCSQWHHLYSSTIDRQTQPSYYLKRLYILTPPFTLFSILNLFWSQYVVPPLFFSPVIPATPFPFSLILTAFLTGIFIQKRHEALFRK